MIELGIFLNVRRQACIDCSDEAKGFGVKGLVIIVEGLGAAMVGAYGSATHTTPAIDRLAARSLVLDQCFIDSFDLELQLRSLWTATHANCARTTSWTLWHELAKRGVPARLITDSATAAREAERYGCPQVTLVDVPAVHEPVAAADECSLMHVFAAAMEELALPETDGVVWIHARGLGHVWDAPLALRNAMIDPDDPPPPSDACVPDMLVDDDTDPDLIVGWGQVAAAQVAVLDEAIDALDLTLSARSDSDQWTWLLSSTGGVPLGEHGRIGRPRREAFSEEIAIPAIIRPRSTPPVGTRRGELCQLPDLPCTLLVAMGADDSQSNLLWGRNMWHLGPPRMTTQWSIEHTLAWLASDDKVWVRTPAWSLLQTAGGVAQLYVKPDDRWEVSDIAARREDIVEELLLLVPQLRSVTEQSARGALPKLDKTLTSVIR
jgi:hypothetical protein